MPKLLIILFFTTVLFSCGEDKNEEYQMKYNYYRHYHIGEPLDSPSKIFYTRTTFKKREDTLMHFILHFDSSYHTHFDTTYLWNNDSVEYKIRFDNEKFGNSWFAWSSELIDTFKLVMTKKQMINDRSYLVYRFTFTGHGTLYPESIFITKEFGIIAQMAYERSFLFLLDDIKGHANKDYKYITQELIDDTIFLFDY